MPGQRVLVVDDDPAVSRVLVRILIRAGYDAVSAPNGRQALECIAEQDLFDAMVCDIDMPEMDGRQLCLHLAASGPYLPACTIIVTSRSELDERSWVNAYAGISLMEKPVSPKQVLQRIKIRLEERIPGGEQAA